ncbi:Small GTPase like protein [Aduncisulcus paluster]|uniref:Small GTPase like protein n=1 Tax=Aduncisulcus paluster TaxID=2918883 RepID=A0ABQ5JY71_9EUKA|nr:Small GTPase like protein [Aduncisulcus paluster]
MSSIRKVILVGDTKVGKTAITVRSVHNSFVEGAPTIGVDFFRKTLLLKTGRSLQARIYDTSGQERFKSLSRSFFQGSDCCIAVASFDVDSSVHKLESWIELVKEHCDEEETVFLLVMNKIDLPGALDDSGMYPVSKADIEAAASKLGFSKVYYTSAKTGEGINELFSDMGEKLVGAAPLPDDPVSPSAPKPLDITPKTKPTKKAKKCNIF